MCTRVDRHFRNAPFLCVYVRYRSLSYRRWHDVILSRGVCIIRTCTWSSQMTCATFTVVNLPMTLCSWPHLSCACDQTHAATSVTSPTMADTCRCKHRASVGRCTSWAPKESYFFFVLSHWKRTSYNKSLRRSPPGSHTFRSLFLLVRSTEENR